MSTSPPILEQRRKASPVPYFRRGLIIEQESLFPETVGLDCYHLRAFTRTHLAADLAVPVRGCGGTRR